MPNKFSIEDVMTFAESKVGVEGRDRQAITTEAP